MSFFKKMFPPKKDKTKHVSVNAFVSDMPHDDHQLSIDEARAVQEQVLTNLESVTDIDAKINIGAQLMIAGDFETSIDVYTTIAELHPDMLGLCESQIGAAYYFLGKYQTAINYYKLALEHGADAAMIADNIEEAEEGLKKH